MKTYTFLIGAADDFESMDALLTHVGQVSIGEAPVSWPPHNYSAFEFEAPESCDQETVTMIGRGIAFSNDWCMDDTFSCVVEGPLRKTLDVGATQIPLPYM